MSRSYKKTPYVTDHSQGTKSMKRIANRMVRRRVKNMNDEELPSHMKSKRMTESWMICDYRWYTSKEEAIKWYLEEIRLRPNGYYAIHYPTIKDYLNFWEKCHRRK